MLMLLRFILAFALAAAARAAEAEGPPPHPLAWDAMEKSSEPKVGEGAAAFVFNVTNRSERAVTITQVRPSCGCTTVDLPSTPWVLAPGAKGAITAIVDLQGKDGTLSKALFVASSAGAQTLLMNVKVPPMDETMRKQNQQAAAVDRQAVFRNECALCHAVPATGKLGSDLFFAVCASCHLSPHRASMVPDLMVAKTPRDAAYWTKWIAEGREGSLMPAFARQHGGPLTGGQIDSIVQYVLANLPTEPRKD